MHPFTGDMHGKRTSANKPKPCYRMPSSRSKNVICVACKRKFNVPDLTKLNRPMLKGTYIPLLLDCGHPICSRCVKVERIKSCSLCKNGIATEDASNQEALLPLNLYALGLLASSFNHPLENDDEDFLFCHRQSAQMRRISKLGCCHECGNQANVSCLQCTILFCYRCFAKIHGKALNFHTQVPIYEGDPNAPAAILNRCSPTCHETLNYFCNDCNVACCSNCTLCSHKMHDFMALSEKNKTLLPEFNEICANIEDTLLRVQQTKEKIESVSMSTNSKNLENISIIEKKITQHFAHLHGILQNTEAELIKQLYEEHVSLKNNLEDLNTQLKSQEVRLNVTLKMASYARQSFQNVDIQNAMEILKDLIDLPCHLMYKDAGESDKAIFNYDNSIIEAIRNHCSIEVSPVSLYSLVRTDELPENYIVSPVKKQSFKKIYEELPLVSLPKKPDSESTTISIKSEDMETGDEKKKDSTQNDNISECKVEVIYVIDPSHFFIRKVISKPEFEEFEKDLMKYGNDRQNAEPLIKLKPNDRCIVREMNPDGKWFRGRVTAVISTEDGGTLYNIFYLDYGCEEYNIPTSRIQNIAQDLLELPPQAIRCCLHGLVPKKNYGWSNASTNDFLKLTYGTDCSMFIINSTDDVLHVDLCVDLRNNMGPQSVCNTMKLMDHARLVDSCNKAIRARASQQTYVYEKEELPLNKFPIQVINTCFESPDKIYVRKLEQQNRFLQLDKELQEYYKGDNSSKIIQSPRKGLPCALQNPDFTWSRGEILEVIDDKVDVFCVDSGNTKVVNCDELRSIPHKYTKLKAQAIRISLMHIIPESNGQWKMESYLTLLKLFEHAKCVTITNRRKIEDGYSACICIDDVDVSQQLKTAGVVNTLQTRKVKDKSLNKSLVSSFKNIRASKYAEKLEELLKDLSYDEIQEEKKPVEKNEITKDLFKVEVRVQRVVTPDCIYVAQMEHKESNMKMITAMQRFYDNFKSEPRDNWSEGALCAVYSAKDKAYFRAKILKINSSTEVLVYFYDMGIEETVTMNDIQILHMKFANEPTYCFNVRLAGILPCGGSSVWPSFSCTTLSDIIQENAYCKYYITKPAQEKVYSDPIPVELWVRQTKIPGPLAPTEIEINSINRMLVEKGVALPIKNYFAKSDSILAAEFKLQLESNYQFVLPEEVEEVKWFNKEDNTDLKDIEKEMRTLSFESDLSCLNSTVSSLSLSTKQTCDSKNRKNVAVKLTDWLPPVEITEEVFHAIPTYVDNKCMVYLHSKKYNADILNYIESELQIHYKKIKVDKNKVWKEGDLCIAKYHYNNKWYRGRIVKDLGNIVKVNFVDYGNEEECEKEHVSHQIRLGHIPIQCTKCIVSGLRPKSLNEKWMLHDLDRIHALLVDHECKVSVLQRQRTHLIVSITLLRPWKCDLLMYLTNHMEMNIKIEHKEWNNEENYESEDLQSNSTSRDVTEKTITDDETCTVNVSRESLSEIYMEETFNENVISGNFADMELSKLESPDESIRQSDFENVSWMEAITSDNQLHACSTPQLQSEEETDFFNVYKELIIPQETQYIELVLCCNKDPITSFAQLAENNDDMFPNMFNNYYLQYETIMLDLQTSAFNEPLIKSFEKNTPCVTKFSDDIWYRCIITNSEKIPDSQCVQISLYYIDFGNYEDRILELFSTDHNLHVPKEEWLEVPPMAIKCTFWGLHFVSKNTTLLASKLDEIYNQKVVARIKRINNRNNIVAEIYKDKTCKELFYDDLIKEGLYQFKNPEED